MPFISSDNFVVKLRGLKGEYEKRKNISLDKAASPYYLSRLFGATDVSGRRDEIKLLPAHNYLQNE